MSKINYYLKRPIELGAISLGKTFYGKPKIDQYLDIRIKREFGLLEIAAVIVPNHCIGADGMILKTIINKPIHFLIQKEGVYDSKLKSLLWLIGEIPVGMDNRSTYKQAIRRAGDYLRWSNDYIGIFSEGPTKSLVKGDEAISLEQREHKTGAAHIAIDNEVPIIPVGLYVNEKVQRYLWSFDKGVDAAWAYLEDHVSKEGKLPYHVNIGYPVYPEYFNKLPKKQRVKEITKVVKERIIGLVNEIKEEYNK